MYIYIVKANEFIYILLISFCSNLFTCQFYSNMSPLLLVEAHCDRRNNDYANQYNKDCPDGQICLSKRVNIPELDGWTDRDVCKGKDIIY